MRRMNREKFIDLTYLVKDLRECIDAQDNHVQELKKEVAEMEDKMKDLENLIEEVREEYE